MNMILFLACSGNIEPAQPIDTEEPIGDSDDQDGDGFKASEDDCDDTNPDVNPGRSESCDGLDNDCNGEIDDDPVDAVTFYVDDDDDGWGDVNQTERACESPGSGYSEQSGDCDDERSDVNPDAQEVCDDSFTDEDCDGTIDDNDDSVDPGGFVTLYEDSDGDGYGNAASSMEACHELSGWVLDDTDCDDTSELLTPENECDLGWYGTYTGDFVYEGTVDGFGTDACTASGVTIDVDPTQTNHITSSFQCTWGGFAQQIIGPQTVNIEGVISKSDTITGGIYVGSLYVDAWTGTISGDAVIEGSFSGETTYSGFDIVYTGTLDFIR